MSAARTLPATPAERACATVLRAYLDYQPAPGDYDGERTVIRVIAGVECLLRDYGLVSTEDTEATPTGAALLARVGAAPDYEQGRRDAITSAADHLSACHDPAIAPRNAARMIVDHEAGRLSGTTPIDAPPAKEHR